MDVIAFGVNTDCLHGVKKHIEYWIPYIWLTGGSNFLWVCYNKEVTDCGVVTVFYVGLRSTQGWDPLNKESNIFKLSNGELRLLSFTWGYRKGFECLYISK